MPPVNTCEIAWTSVPTSDSLRLLSALRSPFGRPSASPNCSARSERKFLACRSALVWATSASHWSSWLSARKIAVRSPKDSCSPPVWGGLEDSSQPGLSASRIAWPVSWATMSSERHVNTCVGGDPVLKKKNFSAFSLRE